MTPTIDHLEKSYELATLDSARGYLHFLDHVVVDAQPTKLPFRHIAESWQWSRSVRSAGAINQLAGIDKTYTGVRAFWEGWHKGSDKTHDNARELCFLLGWSKRRLNCYVCAGKEAQAGLITTAIRGILQDNPWIADRIEVTELSARSLVNGSKLTILPMNAYTGQGVFPDYVIASEVSHWQYDDGKKFWEFILESVNKRPQCVLKVETNAGLKGTWQWEERNRVSKSKYWSFYEAPVGPPLASWMDQGKIDDDSQGLTPGERDRLYKNRWVDPGEEHGYLSLEESMLCRDDSLRESARGERGLGYYLTLDYGGVHDRTALGVTHVVPGKLEAVVDRLDCWQGSHSDRIPILMEQPFEQEVQSNRRSVELWLEVMTRAFFHPTIVLDPSQLEGLAIKYERKGYRVLRFEYKGGKANHRMAQMLKTAVQNRMIRWSPDAGKLPEQYVDRGVVRRIEDTTLEQEMSMLVTRPMLWGYRFDHESGRNDDRSVVLGMALCEMFPEGYPEGSVGPTVVQIGDGKLRPVGSTRTTGDQAQQMPAQQAVRNWNLFGNRTSGSQDWDGF